MKYIVSIVVLAAVGVTAFFYLRKWIQAKERITYEEAISYLVNNKPPVSFDKAVITRQEEIGGTFLIGLVFLDKNEKIVTRPDGSPYGRFIRVKSIDEELLDVFGNKDVIIVT